MKKFPFLWKDAVFSLLTLIVTFILNLLLQQWFQTQTLIPMIFVLGVFLISLRTQGYFWGFAASLISVLAVNYAFTFPYYAFDLITPECLASAVVMLVVSSLTGMLTTQIKRQEQIKAEIQRERMRANLLRAVSHDLRTPLTSIYGASSALLEHYHSLNDEQRLDLTRDVRDDSRWLIRMVENLLSVTRIDSGHVKIAKTPTVLEELIDTVLVNFRKRCPQQEILVELPEDFVSIPMDAMLIEQVLINILENAVDHAKGMTELRLTVQCDGDQARFSIRDNGCGIPAEQMSRLFSGYLNQGTAPVDGSRSNMGIGLSVCAAIAKAHGSEIHARNLESGGAEFYFTLSTQ